MYTFIHLYICTFIHLYCYTQTCTSSYQHRSSLPPLQRSCWLTLEWQLSKGFSMDTQDGFWYWIWILVVQKILGLKQSISGWWFEPLWKISVNWDDYSQYMENRKWQPNHQPDIHPQYKKSCFLGPWNWQPMSPSAIAGSNGHRLDLCSKMYAPMGYHHFPKSNC